MYNFFLLAVVLYIVLVSEVSWTLSISNKDLSELESLIQSYKRVAASSPQMNYVVKSTTEHPQEVEASRVGLRIMSQANSKRCGMGARVNYELCNKNAVKKGDEEECASIFVNAYEKCYFGDSLLKGNSKDLMDCSGSCLRNFDNCLLNSNRVEVFICINARDTCWGRCPWLVNNVSKRTSTNCDSVCQGRFDQCYDVIEQPHEIMLCNVNRNLCRQSSTCEIE